MTATQLIAAQRQFFRRQQILRAYAMLNAQVSGYGKDQSEVEVSSADELKAAIANAKPGTVVRLVSDVDVGDASEAPVALADGMTLDLNGKRLSVKSSPSKFAFVVGNGCDAVIQNGEIKVDGRGLKIDGGSLMVINVKAFGLTSRFAAAYGNEGTRSGAKLIIDRGCVIEGDTTD